VVWARTWARIRPGRSALALARFELGRALRAGGFDRARAMQLVRAAEGSLDGDSSEIVAARAELRAWLAAPDAVGVRGPQLSNQSDPR